MSLIPIDIEAELQRISLAMAGGSTRSSLPGATGSGASEIDQSSMTLEKRKNVFYVRNTTIEGFTRYPCSLEKPSPDLMFIRFIQVPPVVSDGYVWIPGLKSFFKVTKREICKGIIYVTNSKQYVPTTSERRKRTPATSSVETRESSVTASEDVDLGSSGDVESQIQQNADRAFSDQIGTLLNVLAEEDNAEWTIEN